MSSKITGNELSSLFEFKTGLRFEIFYALQLLADDSSRIHREWKRSATSKLPASFFTTNYPLCSAPMMWPCIADVLDTCPLELSLEEIIMEISNCPIEKFVESILIGGIHNQDIVDDIIKNGSPKNALAKVPKKKQEWLAHIGLFPYQKDSITVIAFEELLKDPALFREKVIGVLQEFWNSVFKSTWAQVQSQLQKSIDEKARVFEVCDLEEFSKYALLRIEFDEDKQVVKAIRGGSTVPFKKVGASYFIPSFCNDKRYYTSYENNNVVKFYITYFDPSISIDSNQILMSNKVVEPEIDPALIFRALGDSTRYAMFSLIAKEAHTSLQLAGILSLTKPTISHHLHILREAGLVNEQNHKGSILLTARFETIENLSLIITQQLSKQQSINSAKVRRPK